LATLLTAALAAYAADIALRFPPLQYGFSVKLLLLGAAVMLAISYYWFLRSTVTVDDKGIAQRWLYDRHVVWPEVSSAKLIGIPYRTLIFPPRLVVRTGTSVVTFNGGSKALLVEFAKISLAYQMKR